MSTYNLRIPTALAASALLAACAGNPTNPELEQVQRMYDAASTDRDVQAYAAEEIELAQSNLREAQQAWEDGDERETEHEIYVTKQQIATAREVASAKTSEARVKELRAQRESMLRESRAQETAAAKARVRDLEAQLDAMQTKQTDRGLVVTLGEVLFPFGKAELKSGVQRNLSQLTRALKDHPERNVLIEGYTDSVGSEAYNQRLSEQRAQAVKDFLVAEGIAENRLYVRGYGERFPVASNDEAAGRQQNRRVELVILGEGQEVESAERE